MLDPIQISDINVTNEMNLDSQIINRCNISSNEEKTTNTIVTLDSRIKCEDDVQIGNVGDEEIDNGIAITN